MAAAAFLETLASEPVACDHAIGSALNSVRDELAQMAKLEPGDAGASIPFDVLMGVRKDRAERDRWLKAARKAREAAPEFDATRIQAELSGLAGTLREATKIKQLGPVITRLHSISHSISNRLKADQDAKTLQQRQSGNLSARDVQMVMMFESRKDELPGYHGAEEFLRRRYGVPLDDPEVRARVVKLGLLDA